ncbi:MAG: STAS/SEC14 domain-containing protein [Planctomycetota bacterium]
MIEELNSAHPGILGFKMSGKLHDEDYKTFVPRVDAAIAEEGKVRMLAMFHEFEGWDAHALWDDIKFATTHCTKIDRIALVGENCWQEWMAKVCVPFTAAQLRYFDASEVDGAWDWLAED